METNYFNLFNAITDAIDVLEEVKRKLVESQLECEERYLSEDDESCCKEKSTL